MEFESRCISTVDFQLKKVGPELHVGSGVATETKNGKPPQLHVGGGFAIGTKRVGPRVARQGWTCNLDKKWVRH